MKKIILAAVATSVIAAPVAAAPNGRDNRGRVEQVQRTHVKVVQRNNGRQVVQTRQVVRNSQARGNQGRYNQAQNHRWNRGQRFDNRYASNYRVINNPRAYRLNNAPQGYRWVQSGNDAVLVAVASGIIGAVLAGILN